MFIQDMQHRFIVARWAYLMGEPIISDPEYDALEREYKMTYPESEYSQRGWAYDECPKELLTMYGLTHLIANPIMGYAAESIESKNTWQDFEIAFSSINEPTRVSFKIDGWNTRASYYNGLLIRVETRGRTGNNLNISAAKGLFPRRIPIMGRVAITGELSIPNEKWPAFKLRTGNSDQRASVRTAIAQNDINSLSFLAFNIFAEKEQYIPDAYAKLRELGFITPAFVIVNSYAELIDAVRFMSDKDTEYTHLTDGLVVENSKLQLAVRLGAWQEHSMCSYVTGYEEDVGMYGTYLKVTCAPVNVEGKTFSRVSLNNVGNIISSGLCIGAPIAFALRSSANVVLDATKTYELQKAWAGRYPEYIKMIDKEAKTS